MLYFGIGALLLAGAVAAPPALGQELPASAARARVVQTCQAEARRFCPAGEDGAQVGRNTVICLRPFRTSLSLPCRAAVNAALRPGP